MNDEIQPTGAAIRKAEKAARKDARKKHVARVSAEMVHEADSVAIAQPAREAINRARPTVRGIGPARKREIG